jgi:hypothetical protein
MEGHPANVSRRRAGHGFSLAAVLAVLAFSATAASAQTTNAPASTLTIGPPPALVATPQGCVVSSIPGEADGAETLVANCRGQGLILGRATEYRTFVNPSLNATVVDIRLGSDRRVLLLSLGKDGRPLLENISGEIARVAGKGPMSTIADVGVDFGGFARDGNVAVQPSPSVGGGGQLALGAQVIQEHSH